jgi:hypothetical protein
MIERLSFDFGKPQFIEGARVTVVPETQTFADIIPSEVSFHESEHAVAAFVNGSDVSRITVNPTSEYLGLTELSKFDAVAAVAPHATGASGTGYDIKLVEQLGYDVSSLSKAARGIISSNWTAVEAVARLLEERGTISGFEARQALNSAGIPKEEIVKVTVETLDGKVQEYSGLKANGGTVMLPGVFYKLSSDKQENFEEELPQAA